VLYLAVTPQNPNANVDVTVQTPLAVVVPVSRIDGRPAPTFHAEYSGHGRLRFVFLPATGKLHVSLTDGLPNPCRVTIPVTVWPSRSAWVMASAFVFSGLIGTRWQAMLVSSQSLPEAVSKLWADLPFIGTLLVLGLLAIIVLLRLVDWVIPTDQAQDLE
jgi:hypothetical protein